MSALPRSNFVPLAARPTAGSDSGAHVTDQPQPSNETAYHPNTASPYVQSPWITSRVPTTAQASNGQDSSSPRMNSYNVQQCIQEALRPIDARLVNVEQRNLDPFGDVKQALAQIERKHTSLTKDLKKKYGQSIDEYQRESQRLSAWYAGLKGDVQKYCDERNGELHEAGRATVTRLEALERRDGPADLEDVSKRLATVEASLKSITASRSGPADIKTHVTQHQSSASVSPRPNADEARIYAMETTLRELGERMESTERGRAPCEKCNALESAVDNITTRVKENDKTTNKRFDWLIKQLPGIKDLDPATLRQISQTVGFSDDPSTTLSAARTTSHSDLEQTLTTVFARLGERLTVNAAPASEPATHNDQPSSAQIQALEEKVNQLSDPCVLESLKERLSALEQGRDDNVLQRSMIEAFAKRDVAAANLTARVVQIESENSAASFSSAVEDLRTRLSNVESASLTAALDSRFQSVSDRLTKIGERLDVADNREQVARIVEQVEQMKETSQKMTADKTERASLLQRLNNVEANARTGGMHQTANQSQIGELGKHVKALEDKSSSSVNESEFSMLKERVAVVEGLAADHTLRRTVESLSERQTSTVTDLTGRVGTLEARTESIASSTTKSAQDTEKRLAALEDGSLKAVVDRRFDTLQEELSRLRESTQASAVRERLAASIDRLQKLEERALAAEHSHAVADERYSVLVGDVADLDKRLQAAGQDIKSCESSTLRVAQDVEKTISRLEEKSAALTKVATETANLKDQVYSLNDLMHDTRGWVQRVSEKSERDDREISHQVRTLDTKSERDDEALRSRVRAFDKKHLVRLEATDKQVARLEDDLRSLQTARSAEPAPRKNGIADDVHRLRHSIEENEPDNAARRELSDLFRAVWEHGFTSTRKRPRISDDDEQQGQNATAPRTEASATVGGRVSAGQRVDASEEPTVGGHAEDGDQAIEATTATNQPAAKRRRLDGDEQAGSEERLQPTTLDGEESEHEDSTPRRSHRSNKGRNERLDDEAFGLISGRNWRVKMFRKYQKRPRQTVG